MKYSFQRMTLAMVCLAVIATLLSCASPAATQSILTIKTQTETESASVLQTHHLIASTSAPAEGLTQSMTVELQKKINELSNGTMALDIYPNDTLGTLNDNRWSFTNGSVDIRIGVSSLDSAAVAVWLPTLCGSTPDDIEASMAAGGKLRQIFDEEAAEDGIVILGYYPVNYRVLSSSTPVRSVSDMKTLKMRTVSTGSETLYWGHFCQSAEAIKLKDFNLALQQGIVNAEENTLPLFTDVGLEKHQKYIAETHHKVYIELVTISSQTFSSLSEGERSVLQRSVENLQNIWPSINTSYLNKCREELEGQGVSWTNFPESEQESMRQETAPLLRETLSNSLGSDIVNRVISVMQ